MDLKAQLRERNVVAQSLIRRRQRRMCRRSERRLRSTLVLPRLTVDHPRRALPLRFVHCRCHIINMLGIILIYIFLLAFLPLIHMVIYFYSSGQEKKKKGKKGGKKSKNKKNKKDKKETEDQKKKRLQKEAEAKKKEEQRAEEKKKRDKFAAAKKAPKTPLHQEYMCKLYTSATPDQSKLGSNMN